MNLPTVGQRIAYHRKKAGLKQKDLAATVGISGNAISLYEMNKRKPNISLLMDIAKALRTTGDTLLGLDFPQNNAESAILNSFRILNPLGQERAQEIVSALGEMPKYSE